jgi:hypothetical protein
VNNCCTAADPIAAPTRNIGSSRLIGFDHVARSAPARKLDRKPTRVFAIGAK